MSLWSSFMARSPFCNLVALDIPHHNIITPLLQLYHRETSVVYTFRQVLYICLYVKMLFPSFTVIFPLHPSYDQKRREFSVFFILPIFVML